MMLSQTNIIGPTTSRLIINSFQFRLTQVYMQCISYNTVEPVLSGQRRDFSNDRSIKVDYMSDKVLKNGKQIRVMRSTKPKDKKIFPPVHDGKQLLFVLYKLTWDFMTYETRTTFVISCSIKFM